MRIAQLAPLVERVPPVGYGGTELVVHMLTEELVRRGHEVTLFASGDSLTAGRMVAGSAVALRGHTPPERWIAYDIKQLLSLESMSHEFDIIHNHMGYQSLPYFRNMKCPVVSTNHNNVKGYCAPVYMAFKDMPYVAISHSYQQLNYPQELNYIGVVYNGIDLDLFPYDPRTKRDYLLFIGRVCQDKGTAEAIEVAKRLKLPLKIAGKVDVNDRPYFESRVEPELGNPLIEFLGEVNITQKLELYSKAIAVVYPIAFDEPFGLVMAESLAAGTPVMAFNRGSVREVISDPDTGIICNTVDELVLRYWEVPRIKHSACRERAHNLFSKERMASQYEAIYQSICSPKVWVDTLQEDK